MIDFIQLDDLANKLFSAIPSSMGALEQEMQQKFKDILKAAFAHLDLVSRDEFDVQVKVLARTREKVEALEAQLAALTPNNI